MSAVIVLGGTGFVGSAILNQLIADQHVVRITAITRRPLNEQLHHNKLVNILHTDFTTYSQETINSLLDQHNSCIWAIGGKRSAFSSDSQYELVSLTYTTNFFNALFDTFHNQQKTTDKPTQSFLFCYVSGYGADIAASHWTIAYESRRMKGRVEEALFKKVKTVEKTRFRVVCFRPGGILSPKPMKYWMMKSLLHGLLIGIDELTVAMVKVVTMTEEQQKQLPPVFENNDIRALALQNTAVVTISSKS